MADQISFSFDSSAFDAMTVDIKDPTRKATMYAMRATGRYLARIAKSNAPVYKGPDPRATAESGNLKKSIKNARTLTSAGDSYSLKVGPFGSKKQGTGVVRHGKEGPHSSVKRGTSTKGQVRGVPLYRSKMEAKYGFMAGAIAAADSDATKAIYEAAYAKAWAKWTS